MNARLKIGVYRRLDNRAEGVSDDSPRALELHNRRKVALHAVFDGDQIISVDDWGKTDDSRPHEYVEILLTATASAAFQYAIVPGVKWLALKLAEKAIDTAASELAKAIVARLRPKQEARQILDVVIELPDSTKVLVDPPDRAATIRIHFADGTHRSLEYLKSDA